MNIFLKITHISKLWRDGNHPVELDSTKTIEQRLDYLHNNPVAAGYVSAPHHWINSSASDYYSNEKGAIELDML